MMGVQPADQENGDTVSDLEVRGVRGEIASREYDGVGSLADALGDRQRMSAAVEAAKRAKLAGDEERQWMWTARESERTLGRMITAARDAGDLASGGERTDLVEHDDKVSTLADLGISRDLAAYAVGVAAIPDEVWAKWQQAEEPTRRNLSRAVHAYRAAVKDAEREEQDRAERAEELEQEQERITESLRALAEQDPAEIHVPPLEPAETNLAGLQTTVEAAAAEDEQERDSRGDAWLALFRQMEKFARLTTTDPPDLPADQFLDMTVLAARDLARRITDGTALWVRAVNTQYTERLSK